jgi:hypothetical protein
VVLAVEAEAVNFETASEMAYFSWAVKQFGIDLLLGRL